MPLSHKIFFIINAVVWIPYALVCTANPQILQAMGVFSLSSWVETVEVRAMYGGAQLAIGLFAVVALLKPQLHAASAVLFMTMLFAGLASVRFAGLVFDESAVLFSLSTKMEASSYNSGALWFFEIPMCLFGLFLLSRGIASADD